MQKLEERNTYTPANIPHVRSNCDSSLNREETHSVLNLKTSSNSSDAALTVKGHTEQNLRVSVVYVLNLHGNSLMPTTPGKARVLLKDGRATAVKRTPIQLKYATGETKQKIILGIDSRYTNIGLSATTDRKEVYSAKVDLREGKSKDRILEVHHKISRQIGGDAPDNLITLCRTCHEKVSRGKLNLDIIIPTCFTPNDAFIIAGGRMQKRNAVLFLMQQVRKCNRKLFQGDRSHIRNTADRIIHGFQRYDKVLWHGIECFIFGRRRTAYFELRKLDGTTIHASAKTSEFTLLENVNTLLIETLKRGTLFHPLKSEVSATSAPHEDL